MLLSGVNVQTGSAFVASPVRANAWQRHPPKSIAFRGQLLDYPIVDRARQTVALAKSLGVP